MKTRHWLTDFSHRSSLCPYICPLLITLKRCLDEETPGQTEPNTWPTGTIQFNQTGQVEILEEKMRTLFSHMI